MASSPSFSRIPETLQSFISLKSFIRPSVKTKPIASSLISCWRKHDKGMALTVDYDLKGSFRRKVGLFPGDLASIHGKRAESHICVMVVVHRFLCTMCGDLRQGLKVDSFEKLNSWKKKSHISLTSGYKMIWLSKISGSDF